jgi:hypothetical protein
VSGAWGFMFTRTADTSHRPKNSVVMSIGHPGSATPVLPSPMDQDMSESGSEHSADHELVVGQPPTKKRKLDTFQSVRFWHPS